MAWISSRPGLNNMKESPSPFEALWESFYSADLYRGVQKWRGMALLYLGMVLVLCWTPQFMKIQILSEKFLDRLAMEASVRLPVIRFENGHITTPENKPYWIRVGEAPQQFGMIIDTSGKYSSLEGQDAQILVTRDKIFTRQKNGEVRIYDLSKSKLRPMTMDHDFIQKVLAFIRRWVLPAVYLLLFVLSYIKRLIEAFFISLVGLALVSSLETNLDLGELFSLAIVAMTPAMLLETAVSFSGKPIRFQWFISGLLIAGYFIFAVNAATDSQTPAE
jgi:hypothetical protein